MYDVATVDTATINLSLPKNLLSQIDQQARKESRSRSELIREAARSYLKRISAWDEIFKYGRRKGKQLGIKSEEDIYRMVQEYRRENN